MAVLAANPIGCIGRGLPFTIGVVERLVGFGEAQLMAIGAKCAASQLAGFDDGVGGTGHGTGGYNQPIPDMTRSTPDPLSEKGGIECWIGLQDGSRQVAVDVSGSQVGMLCDKRLVALRACCRIRRPMHRISKRFASACGGMCGLRPIIVDCKVTPVAALRRSRGKSRRNAFDVYGSSLWKQRNIGLLGWCWCDGFGLRLFAPAPHLGVTQGRE